MSIFNFFSFSYKHLSIFEIYPQSEIPLLTQIAHLKWNPFEEVLVHFLPDTLICRIRDDKTVFKVVNFRTNYSTCFTADVDTKKSCYSAKVFFVLSKILELASNYLLGRHLR